MTSDKQRRGRAADWRVLYVIGWGRSGSTLLGNLVGELPGAISVGELRLVWKYWGTGQGVCGCGKTLRACEVWSRVYSLVVDGEAGPRIDPLSIVDCQQAVLRPRHFPGLMGLTPLSRAQREALSTYSRAAGLLYKAIRQATDAQLIVDCSKLPTDGLVVASLPAVSSLFLHLVRDPRATAFSWQRETDLQPGTHSRLPRHRPWLNAVAWTYWNAAAEVMRRREDEMRWTRMRYEDLVRDPVRRLKSITGFLGYDSVDIPVTGHSARLGIHHTVGGNRARFATGTVELQEDNEWITRLPSSAKATNTVIPLPLLLRYGYPLRVRLT